jgi:UDP-N-acetylmuramoyl-L-alanyl-D-glutamate--2,6-diaminopimelate ligase
MEWITLKQLLKGIPNIEIKGSKDVMVTGVTSYSQSVAPGNLFLARKGKNFDAAQFLPQVIASGAVAVAIDLFDPFLKGVVQVVHPNISEIEPIVADRFYRSPTKELFLVGITGTNGKTTTAYLVRHLFDTLGVATGLLGSIERIVRGTYLPAPCNTPDISTSQKLFRDMVQGKEQAAVMEVSSHGLVQGRVSGLHFSVAVFTNLTQDHLDYHGTMQEYGEAKAALFSMLQRPEQVAVVNADDPNHLKMIANCKGRVVTYGIENQADLRADMLSLMPHGTEFRVCFEGEKRVLKSSLIGRFNVSNCLAAIGVGLARGFTLEECVMALQSFTSVSGRMERVPNTLGLSIFVDYSHTEDSLEKALLMLTELKKGKIFTVFGCGGDRDRDKRPKMGRIAERLSDHIFITSDNPRTEDPGQIIAEIVQGLKDPHLAHIVPSRGKAIYSAIEQAKEGDIILIAGKGHEPYQICGIEKISFDDREVAWQACEHIVQK